MGCHFLLQGIFPTQGLNLGLLHCRQILYHLNLKWSLVVISKERICFIPNNLMKIFLFGELFKISNWSICPIQNIRTFWRQKVIRSLWHSKLLTMNALWILHLVLDNGKDWSRQPAQQVSVGGPFLSIYYTCQSSHWFQSPWRWVVNTSTNSPVDAERKIIEVETKLICR